MHCTRIIRRCLGRDLSGTITLEFALILPVILLGIFGTAAAIDVMNAKRRVDMVGSRIGELTAGLPVLVTNDDLQQLSRAAELVLLPYPLNDLTITLKSVRWDSAGENPCVDWSETWPRKGTGTPTATGWETGDTDLPPNIPAGFASPNSAMIAVQVRYTMSSPFAAILENIYSNIVMGDRSFWTPEDLVFLRRIEALGDAPLDGLCTF